MRLAVTGFVSREAGSMASANAIYLQWLLEAGVEIAFFSKSTFVDPRSDVGNHPALKFFETDNRRTDRLRRFCRPLGVLGRASALLDSYSYNRLLIHRMRKQHAVTPFDLCFWMGDYPRGRIAGVPSVGFVQGAPGSDARSICRHYELIRRLGGARKANTLRLLATLRLSRAGLPPFHFADHFLVGSKQSIRSLGENFQILEKKCSSIAYPVDLQHFSPKPAAKPASGPLRCLWLGRIVPRKRLDLFLDAAALAVRDGVDLQITIVGKVGSVAPGFERLIREFPHPGRLVWKEGIPRQEVPALMAAHDLLVQPSEEEDFGSSVAEAQACGLPVVIGKTNGNADYLSSSDCVLSDDQPETLAEVLARFAKWDLDQWKSASEESRRCAENNFAIARLGPKIEEILSHAIFR